jgi:aspartate ammonia-lyase
MQNNQEQPIIDALRAANETLVENLMTAQERNLKYAQGIFASTIEVLKSNVANTRTLLEKQQETFQKLAPAQTSSSELSAYADLFRLPLNSFQQMLDLLETTSKEGLASFQKATESFEKVTQQGLKQWQDAVEMMQQNVQRPVR